MRHPSGPERMGITVQGIELSHIFYLENGLGQELELEVEKKSEDDQTFLA